MNNKILKKICGLFGYRLIDKKFFKNNRLISSQSALSINKILSELFKQNLINSIVQIGANDGVRFDDLNEFINKHKVKSLLVEPIKSNFEKLQSKYNNLNFVKLENSAILMDKNICSLYKVDEKFLSYYGAHIPGITSFNKQHLLKHGVKKKHIIEEIINSITIKELIDKHNIMDLDLFYIDTEGYDGKIVIDFLSSTNLKPVIIFEFIHIDNDIFENLLFQLNKNGYKTFSLNENAICFPNTKKISLSF
tara:strand:+ start:1802 stop:2551 length:750 start_codon:yes stop_codon:yes gene_type:complete